MDTAHGRNPSPDYSVPNRIVLPPPEKTLDQEKPELPNKRPSHHFLPNRKEYETALDAWLEQELHAASCDSKKAQLRTAASKCRSFNPTRPAKRLDLSDLELQTLPPLPFGVQRLHLAGNRLTELPALRHSAVTVLDVRDNELARLPDLPSGLKTLTASGNRLHDVSALDHSNLSELDLARNAITSIPDSVMGAIFKYKKAHLVDFSGNSLDAQTDLALEKWNRAENKSFAIQKQPMLDSTRKILFARHAEQEEKTQKEFQEQRKRLEERNAALLLRKVRDKPQFDAAMANLRQAGPHDDKAALFTATLKHVGSNLMGDCLPISLAIAKTLSTGEMHTLADFNRFARPKSSLLGDEKFMESMGVQPSTFTSGTVDNIEHALLQHGDRALALIFPNNSHAAVAFNSGGQIYVAENFYDSAAQVMTFGDYKIWQKAQTQHQRKEQADGKQTYSFGIMKDRLCV